MSRATVRAATMTWLAPSNIAGLANLFNCVPKFSSGTAYFEGPGSSLGNGSGAQAFLHILYEDDKRYAVGGTGTGGMPVGKKFVTYDMGVILRFRSVRTDPVAYMGDYDTIIENLKVRIRQGRDGLGTTGQQNPVFVAGETGYGIQLHSPDPPRQSKGSVYIWSNLEFQVMESIVA